MYNPEYSKTEKYKNYQKQYRELHKKTYKEKRKLSYYKRQAYYKNLYQEKKQYFKEYREQRRQYYREYYQKYRLLYPNYYNVEEKQKRKLLKNEVLQNITKPKQLIKPLDNNFEIPNKIIIKI